MNTRKVIAWSLWDWGSAAFNAVIITFIFSVYLVESVGKDIPGPIAASTYYTWTLAFASLCIALLAPVSGQNNDAKGRRKRSLIVLTVCVTLCSAGMFFVEDHYTYLWLGLLLVAVGSVLFDLAEVPYFAMLRQVSTPDNVGRVSGIGWGAGYLGGIFLLAICYFGFIAGDGNSRGFLGISKENGFNIRVVVVLAAIWFLVFALPVFFSVPEIPVEEKKAKDTESFFQSYVVLWGDIKDLWRTDRNTLFFLGASAIYRDGLAAVFAIGAVIAVTVYDVGADNVLIFGIVANVISAAGAFAAGSIDDRIGPKPVIVVSLAGMIAMGVILLFLSGPMAFWIFGLVLCAFVGPAQSASRTFLTRITPVGREGQAFGLYMMTGRAVSFMAPGLFGLFVLIGGDDRWGIIGIVLVLAAGLLALLGVNAPSGDRAHEAPDSPRVL